APECEWKHLVRYSIPPAAMLARVRPAWSHRCHAALGFRAMGVTEPPGEQPSPNPASPPPGGPGGRTRRIRQGAWKSDEWPRAASPTQPALHNCDRYLAVLQ